LAFSSLSPWPTGRSIDYGREITSSQFLSSMSSPIGALVNRPYPIWNRARTSLNLELFNRSTDKAEPDITKGSAPFDHLKLN
jgi:hypothetical protein